MSSHETHAAPKNETHPLHLGLLLFGGLCLGTGILNLYYSFGWEGGDFNSDFGQVGFSGLDNISLLPAADFAIPMVVVGALCLIVANATAWRETDGY
jgi:hypothetical protein